MMNKFFIFLDTCAWGLQQWLRDWRRDAAAFPTSFPLLSSPPPLTLILFTLKTATVKFPGLGSDIVAGVFFWSLNPSL